MWLKTSLEFNNPSDQSPRVLHVELLESEVAPVDGVDRCIRISPIFPLIDDGNHVRQIDDNAKIYFFEFDFAFSVLARASLSDVADLKRRIFFSSGSASILLVSDDDTLYSSFEKLGVESLRAKEVWEIREGTVISRKPEIISVEPCSTVELNRYQELPLELRSIIDEFAMSAKIIIEKSTGHRSYTKVFALIEEINEFIEDLTFLCGITDKCPPNRYYSNDAERVSDPLERLILIHQIVDRIIQINSTLSYISTQLFAGSIPILERRSLIRRNSLLGVGMAIRALERLVDFFESAFESISFAETIKSSMRTASALKGLDNPLAPNRSSWNLGNIDEFPILPSEDRIVPKLSYFSSRYGFRETEYAVTASMNSLSSGLSLEWSLLTITHELLHSHVRLILTAIFFEKDEPLLESFKRYFERFRSKIVSEKLPDDYFLIDSIREIIFVYCIRTQKEGSLTVPKLFESEFEFRVKNNFEEFYNRFRTEQRNINEILVHVLDLHYFYEGRVKKYIPLIWCSWSGVPHVYADLRQYILRSLLVIASKLDPKDSFERFNLAVKQFKSILTETPSLQSDFPLISRVLSVLEDKKLLNDYYFNAFSNGLLLVDLAYQIFFSEVVKSKLTEDENISKEPSDSDIEDSFSYDIPHIFTEVEIKAPVAYLFDRMQRVFRGELPTPDTERNTVMSLLAIKNL